MGAEFEPVLTSELFSIVISLSVCNRFRLCPSKTSGSITVPESGATQVFGEVDDVPVSFDTITVPLVFLVLVETPIELLIGETAMEALGAEIDLRCHMITFSIGKDSIRSTLTLLNKMTEELSEESVEFTSDDIECDEKAPEGRPVNKAGLHSGNSAPDEE